METSASPVRVIAFVGDGIFAPVLDSQVLMPLNVVGRVAPEIQRALLVLTGIRHKASRKVDEREKEVVQNLPGAKAIFKYRTILHVPFESYLWSRKLKQAIVECGYAGDAPIIVHCRGRITAAAAAVLKRHDPRIRILLDVRGAAVDEVKGFGPFNGYIRWTNARMTTMALKHADAINTVSHKLADYLRDFGNVDRDIPRSVVACCVDTRRFYFDPATRAAARKELGFDGKFVVCYCGAMSHWQRPDAIAAAFHAIRREMPDAHMFAVSREAGPLIDHLNRLGIDSKTITVREASHDKVSQYLMAGDVGMLLREDSLTNRVAAPVKFAEYLRCGLPVILTPYVGDFADYVAQDGLGGITTFPVESSDVVRSVRAVRDRLNREGDAYRAYCSNWAEKRLSWDGQIVDLVRIYKTLAAGRQNDRVKDL